ncbi:MAG: hypothetical protein PHD56_09195 [Anaerostipes sp.]|nr:hypothetical protein [Anaerostipes sp.]
MIGYLNHDEFLTIADDILIKYNKKKKQKMTITKMIGMQNGNVILKKDKLYYMNMKGNMYQVNLSNGRQKKIISIGEIEKIKIDNEGTRTDMTVNYSKDYIIIDTYLNFGQKNITRKLLIFNYKGEKQEKKNYNLYFYIPGS